MAKKILLLILSVCMLTGFSTLAYAEAADNSEDITIKSEDKILVKDVDYTLEYKDNIKQGTATVIINFIGNYAGQTEQSFNIIRESTNSGGNSHSGVFVNNKDNIVHTTEVLSDITETNAVEHNAYINGYEDNTFKPDGDMSRAEAAAIFARLIADAKTETISGKATFTDIDKNGWYADYIGYLAKYKVIEGYNDGTFKPDAPVSRAEFVAMSVRYYSLFNEVKKGGYTVKYTDVSKKYWAYDDIAYAKNIGWLNGYADGTFKGDNNITRAEVVTVVNHATGRTADKDYINKNVSTLNKFTDLKNNAHWGYYEIMESANTHKAAISEKAETWVK